MLNKYPGVCPEPCGAPVAAQKGAYVRGTVLCAACAPPESLQPEAAEQLPKGMEAVEVRLTGGSNAIEAMVERLQLMAPLVRVRSVQKYPAADGNELVHVLRTHVYVDQLTRDLSPEW